MHKKLIICENIIHEMNTNVHMLQRNLHMSVYVRTPAGCYECGLFPCLERRVSFRHTNHFISEQHHYFTMEVKIL
jgi:hypothetical protein